ncbi:MAG: hypothetical protein QG599_2045 [Pseudomonadota bacterium]|nr:hypothetical protein [Pseudomonadota bacterium]
MTALLQLTDQIEARINELYDQEEDFENLVQNGSREEALKAGIDLAVVKAGLRELNRVADWVFRLQHGPETAL